MVYSCMSKQRVNSFKTIYPHPLPPLLNCPSLTLPPLHFSTSSLFLRTCSLLPSSSPKFSPSLFLLPSSSPFIFLHPFLFLLPPPLFLFLSSSLKILPFFPSGPSPSIRHPFLFLLPPPLLIFFSSSHKFSPSFSPYSPPPNCFWHFATIDTMFRSPLHILKFLIYCLPCVHYIDKKDCMDGLDIGGK